jgi:hypothetical protein
MRRTTYLLMGGVLMLAACSNGSDQGTKSTTPRASASPSVESSPRIDADSMLVGAWEGKVIEAGIYTTWSTRVTIHPCAWGEPCGRFSFTAQDWYRTGRKGSCGGTLSYEGTRDPGIETQDHSFTFQETVTWNRGVLTEGIEGITRCVGSLMALTPLQDRMTLGIQEYWEGGWGTYGLLRMTF